MVLPYCSGTEKIFESEANLPHLVHIWKDELLQYQLVIWHRPRMMWEFNIMSLYNKVTELCRLKDF